MNEMEFTELAVSENLRARLYKITDNIVYADSKGDQSRYNTKELAVFNENMEKFCREKGVKMPYVQIHNLTEVKGRHPYATLRAQVQYFKDNQHIIIGLITIGISSWFMQAGVNAVNFFKPATKFVFCDTYDEAVNAAHKIVSDDLKQRWKLIDENSKNKG